MITKETLLSKFKFFLPSLITFLILFIVSFFFFINNILHIISSGHAGVRWSFCNGTEVDYVYPEGFHLILPCDEMYIYDVRIQEISKELEVLSKTGLKVKVLLSIRFGCIPSDSEILHLNILFDSNMLWPFGFVTLYVLN